MNQPRILRMLRLMTILSGPVHFSIDELAERIEASRRTIFRYLDTFRSAGFVVDRTPDNRYRMLEMSERCRNLHNILFFSDEEARVLAGLIDGLHESNGLKRNLHAKLCTIFDKTDISRYIDDRDRAFNIDSLRRAIEKRHRVIIRDYKSSCSGTVHDAVVEPYEFSGEYVNVYAFDVSRMENRVYKISRMGGIEHTGVEWQFSHLHRKDHIDVFRMMGPTLTRVVLEMDMTARNLLIEEYPMAESQIHETDRGWILETDVTSMAGVGRFVMGLSRDIRVIDSPELSAYIESYLNRPVPDDGWLHQQDCR